MTLDEKIGQLFMIEIHCDRGPGEDNENLKIIRRYAPGGVLIFSGTPEEEVNLLERLQSASKIPLLVGLDGEHGVGWRLKGPMTFPQMQTLGAIDDDSLIMECGAAIARHCRAVGVNINFAPDADVNSNPLNPIIGVRSFGEIPENVGRKAIAYMDGCISEGVVPVAKHFPGHGDTYSDSHLDLPIVKRSREMLQTTEFIPFEMLIEAGTLGIMTGHISFPALDSSGISSSLSPLVVKGLLTDYMGFNGLKFTDALNMKGATKKSKKGETELQALLAGNDVLLYPENIGAAFKAIKKAVEDGRISESEIDRHVEKIMQLKRVLYGDDLTLYEPPSKNPDTLYRELHTLGDSLLREKLYAKALTLIRNEEDLLPLRRPDTLRIATLYYNSPIIEEIQDIFAHYAEVTPISSQGMTLSEIEESLKDYGHIIIYNATAGNNKDNNYGFSIELLQLIDRISAEKRVILYHPATPYGVANYMNTNLDAVLIGYEKTPEARRAFAQAIFGGIDIEGVLPVSVSPKYPAGYSIKRSRTRLGYGRPEYVNLSSERLKSIDSICMEVIKQKAAPGCEVLIAKDGVIVYDKAFGTHTYDSKIKNSPGDYYDVASVTKVTATLSAVMQMYDERRFSLSSRISALCKGFDFTENKDDITFAHILCHNSGFPAGIPFLAKAIDTTSIKRNPRTGKLENITANTKYRFRPNTVSNTPRKGYIKCCDNLYVHPSYIDTCYKWIGECSVSEPKKYWYSDLNFIILGKFVESCVDTTLDVYCRDNIFIPIGALRTGFATTLSMNSSEVVPSNIDKIYKRGLIQGVVHDPTAALFGGVSGHAGLFSTAEDLAKIMDMYMQHGEYGGEHIIDSTTVTLFSSATLFENNRRGIGFDKPEPNPEKKSPTCREASLSSFGQAGFTGTMVWCDPEYSLIYIFLSNRTYPDENNQKLTRMNARTAVQQVAYQAIIQ